MMPLSCIILGTLFVSSTETILFSAPDIVFAILHVRKQHFRSGNSFKATEEMRTRDGIHIRKCSRVLTKLFMATWALKGDMLTGGIVSSQKDTLSPNSQYL